MSLDISLMKVMRTSVFGTNITHNLTRMAGAASLYSVLWRPEDNGIKFAHQLIEPLRQSIKDMESRPDWYKVFDAPNGWGTYDQFLPWLKDLLKACEDFPDAEIEVSR